jgi:hypothetical protein
MPPTHKKTVIQKDGILYIVDHPAYTKKAEVLTEHKQHKQPKQPNSIISQCYENHKKLGVTYPDSIQSQFRLIEASN